MRSLRIAMGVAAIHIAAGGAAGVTLPQTSTYDTDLDGWTLLGPAYESLEWMPSEDGPGGCLFLWSTGPGFAQISAPSRFLGSWSFLERRAALTWDQRFFADFGYQGHVSAFAAGISGPGGSAQFVSGQSPLIYQWIHVVAPLFPERWQMQSGSWPALLANVTQVWIRIEVVEGYASTHYIDNVALVPLSPADLDGDQHVDSADWVLFDTCRSGPAIPLSYTSDCPYADFDFDGDVDHDDFGVFQRCYSGPELIADADCAIPGPHVADGSRTPCERGEPRVMVDDYPWCGDDQIDALVLGPSLEVTHRNAAYNCCLTDIEVMLAATGRTLRFFEAEIVPQHCACLCCYDRTTVVSGLTPGAYHVEYCWLDWGVGYTCVGRDVTVPP